MEGRQEQELKPHVLGQELPSCSLLTAWLGICCLACVPMVSLCYLLPKVVQQG